MERLGFIHDKLEIKILVLFILNRLPTPVSFDQLTELVLCDDGFSYFDYTECLTELERTGHIQQEAGKYGITDKGRRNGSVTETSIPYSVRIKAERAVLRVTPALLRDSMIKTSSQARRDGCYDVTLRLSDGIGEMLAISIIAPSEQRAVTFEKVFRRDAEKILTELMNRLSDET